MSVRLADGIVIVEDTCPVEEAEPLLALLQSSPDRKVDLSRCIRAHSAVIQVILAADVTLYGPMPQGFLGEWILAGLDQKRR